MLRFDFPCLQVDSASGPGDRCPAPGGCEPGGRRPGGREGVEAGSVSAAAPGGHQQVPG